MIFSQMNAQLYLSTLAGTGTATSTGDDGPATLATVANPAKVWVGGVGNVFIGEFDGNRVRRISSSGIITTLVGKGGSSSTAGIDGVATSVALDRAYGVYGDTSGTYLYVTGGAYFVWRYDFTTKNLTRIAGTAPGTGSFSGDGGPATLAKLNGPRGIYLSSLGIAEANNNRIRFINTANQVINTFAGNGTTGYRGDNRPATTATMWTPNGVWGNSVEIIFIADTNNHRICKVDLAGIITTFAGTGSTTYNNDNIPASSANLYTPTDVKGDTMGSIYIAEASGCRIRQVSVSGIITTIIGTGSCIVSSTVVASDHCNCQNGFWFMGHLSR